jgi:multidrug transporter EmrE-like cation transporter
MKKKTTRFLITLVVATFFGVIGWIFSRELQIFSRQPAFLLFNLGILVSLGFYYFNSEKKQDVDNKS